MRTALSSRSVSVCMGAVILVVLLLAGCSVDTKPESSAAESITVSNCGREVTVAAPDVEAIVENPAFAGLRAVQHNGVHAFLFADRSAGGRTAHEIELVASLIHPDRVQ